MKFLVTIKDVEDPEVRVQIKPDGSWIDTAEVKYVVNPFDEIAVEEALRLKERHGGEIVVVCVGTTDASQRIRTALAVGADRGVLIRSDARLEPSIVAKALAKLIQQEQPDLVLMGKQAVDDDQGQVGAMVAEHLGWGQATFASKVANLESEEEKSKVPGLRLDQGRVEVVREIDGGMETVTVKLPAVVTTDLRLNLPRYASLPGIMKAKKKPIRELPLAELAPDRAPRLEIVALEAPPKRAAGKVLPDVAALVEKLRNEAKVI